MQEPHAGWVRRCRSGVRTRLDDPVWMRRFHGWATLVWFVAAFPSMLSGLKNSVAYLVFLSVYAIVASHFSSWQASRAEIVADPDIDHRSV
jgi:hypothetical protein